MDRERRAVRLALVTFGPFGRLEGGLAVRSAVVRKILEDLNALAGVVVVEESRSAESRGQSSGFGSRLPAREGSIPLWTVEGRGRVAWMRDLRRTLRALDGTFDGFVVESALLGLATLGLAGPVIWDTNECETLHYLRLPGAPGVKARLVAWFVIEMVMGLRSAVVVAVSEVEAAHWRRLFPWTRKKVQVGTHVPLLGHGRDAAAGRRIADHGGVVAEPGARSPEPGARSLEPGAPSSPTSPGGRYVLFLGNLLAKHNRTAAAFACAEVAPTLPDGVRLVLAGQGTAELCPERAERVEGLGFVDDVDSLIAGAECAVAPLLSGAGVKTKVLHAIALGTRVVATPVALEGIEGAPGVVVAEATVFANAVGALLAAAESPNARAARRAAQAQWCAARFDEARLRREWSAIIAAAFASRRRR